MTFDDWPLLNSDLGMPFADTYKDIIYFLDIRIKLYIQTERGTKKWKDLN